jgi:L-amino acid N-acyltransferase YncA
MIKASKAPNGRTHEDHSYPRELKLPDGRHVALRLMDSTDKHQILSFARALPANDLLFLRTDITEAGAIDDWIGNIARGTTVTMLAEIDGHIVGYAALHTDQARWTRHVGEIRVQVGPRFRGIGLGRRLAAEILHMGQSQGIKKMAAMMTPDQTGARAAFEKLGFEVEALLQNWVVDRDGRSRDLLIMSYSLERPSNHVNA